MAPVEAKSANAAARPARAGSSVSAPREAAPATENSYADLTAWARCALV